jgi:moderate conductance mechanosensitive channel
VQNAVVELLDSFGLAAVEPWVMLIISSLNVILIVVLALIVRRVARRLLRAVHEKLGARAPGIEEKKRIDTLGRIAGYLVSVLIGIIAGMLILSELGVSIAPFLATAGVAGIAISFGAQSLVKDYFTGFVMLVENQIRQGDVVDVAGKSGRVEEVTLRYVRLRDGEGAVHYVPNSSISTVTNHSREFAYAVVEVGVSYSAHLGKTYEVIKEVGRQLREDPVFAEKILEDIEIMGVSQLADSSVTLRIRMKVVALEQWGVRREILAQLKQAFDAAGIEIPFPQRVVRIAKRAN